MPQGGLPLGTLHEVLGPPGDAARVGFVVVVVAMIEGRVLWCCERGQENGLPYGPGLLRFGLSPDRVIFVDGQSKTDTLWAMEEALRSGTLAAVIGEGVAPDTTASRRLQLAAETGGTAAFILPAKPTQSLITPMRWRVAAVPAADGFTRPRWRVDLERCRGAVPRSWCLDWDDVALRFSLPADLADRLPVAAASA